MNIESTQAARRWTLRLDGGFLASVGGAAMLADTVGHSLGIGPLARTLGSPYTIGGFEAHGLAMILGLFMLSEAGQNVRLWHVLGLVVHLLLGSANLLFWTSFVQMDLVAVGVITTAFHVVFAGANAIVLGGGASPAGRFATPNCSPRPHGTGL